MTIAEIVAQIRTAVYGRDVRESIAKGIETIDDNVFNNNSDLTGRMGTLEEKTTNKINTLNTNLTTLDTRETSRHNYLIDRTDQMVNKESNDVSNINTNVATLANGLATANTNVTTLANGLATANANITTLTNGLATTNHNLNNAEDNITNHYNAFLDLKLPMTGTNLLKGTETFDKSYWTIGSNVSVIDNIMGKLKGTRATINNSYAYQKFTFVQGTAYILSAFIRTDKQHGVTVSAVNALFDDNASRLVLGEFNGNGFGGWYEYVWKFTATAAHAGEKQVGIYATDIGTGYNLDVCGMQIQWGVEVNPYMPSLKADMEQQPWQNMVLEGGWTNRPGLTPAQYYKDSLGRVHLRGTLDVGTASDMFTLPIGYRPDYTLYDHQQAQDLSWNDTTRNVWVTSLGRIGVDISDLRVIHLEGINFRAEQ